MVSPAGSSGTRPEVSDEVAGIRQHPGPEPIEAIDCSGARVGPAVDVEHALDALAELVVAKGFPILGHANPSKGFVYVAARFPAKLSPKQVKAILSDIVDELSSGSAP
jgi:hypothetical protein